MDQPSVELHDDSEVRVLHVSERHALSRHPPNLAPGHRKAVRPLDIAPVATFEHRHRARSDIIEDGQQQAPPGQSTSPGQRGVQASGCRRPFVAGIGQQCDGACFVPAGRGNVEQSLVETEPGRRQMELDAPVEVGSARHDHPGRWHDAPARRHDDVDRFGACASCGSCGPGGITVRAPRGSWVGEGLSPCARSAEGPASAAGQWKSTALQARCDHVGARCGLRRRRGGPEPAVGGAAVARGRCRRGRTRVPALSRPPRPDVEARGRPATGPCPRA